MSEEQTENDDYDNKLIFINRISNFFSSVIRLMQGCALDGKASLEKNAAMTWI